MFAQLVVVHLAVRDRLWISVACVKIVPIIGELQEMGKHAWLTNVMTDKLL